MLLLLLILSLSFGQLARFELAPGIIIYLHDLFVVLLLIFYLPKVKTFSTPLTRPIVAFGITAMLSLLFALSRYPPPQVLTGSLYLFRWLAYALVYFVARESLYKSQLIRWLTFAGLIVAIVGLLQYFFLPDTRFLYFSGWDEHYYRLIGTFFDPNFTGIFLVLSLILLMQQPRNILNSLFLVTCFLSLLLTYSRSSYLAFLAILVFHLRRQKLLLLVSCILLLVILLLLPRPAGEGIKLERLYSLTNRLDSMKAGFKIFTSHPITGIGFNLLRYQQNNFLSHSGAGIDNSFIFLLATTGIPGFLAYLWLLKKQFEFKLPATRYALLAIIIHSLFNNTLFYAPVMLWLWLLLAADT